MFKRVLIKLSVTYRDIYSDTFTEEHSNQRVSSNYTIDYYAVNINWREPVSYLGKLDPTVPLMSLLYSDSLCWSLLATAAGG